MSPQLVPMVSQNDIEEYYIRELATIPLPACLQGPHLRNMVMVCHRRGWSIGRPTGNPYGLPGLLVGLLIFLSGKDPELNVSGFYALTRWRTMCLLADRSGGSEMSVGDNLFLAAIFEALSGSSSFSGRIKFFTFWYNGNYSLPQPQNKHFMKNKNEVVHSCRVLTAAHINTIRSRNNLRIPASELPYLQRTCDFFMWDDIVDGYTPGHWATTFNAPPKIYGTKIWAKRHHKLIERDEHPTGMLMPEASGLPKRGRINPDDIDMISFIEKLKALKTSADGSTEEEAQLNEMVRYLQKKDVGQNVDKEEQGKPLPDDRILDDVLKGHQ